MPTLVEPPPIAAADPRDTLADLVERLGNIPLSRIRLHPFPGSATPEDVTRLQETRGILCELVDGVLVEKPMGYREARLAMRLGSRMNRVAEEADLGPVTGPDGTMKILADQVRIPDVAFVRWTRLPGGRVPDEPIPRMAPNLAVEILSESNTPAEMDRKRAECFAAGTELFWEIDPRTRTARVFTSLDAFVTLTEADSLDGGDVLPGFRLPLRELFAELDRHG